MRGRKQSTSPTCIRENLLLIKKESPNEGTETAFFMSSLVAALISIKKESPNEGTETSDFLGMHINFLSIIKKESPNEGTETLYAYLTYTLWVRYI